MTEDEAPMEIYGAHRQVFNMELVLWMNCETSLYYQNVVNLEFDQLLDEVFESVTHCEPWMGGGAAGPSSMFCILRR